MRYSVSGLMKPESAFVADNEENFRHDDFEVSVAGAKLTVSHDETSLGGEAIALGLRFVNMLTARTGQAITWMPDEYSGVGDDGKRRTIKTFAPTVKLGGALGMVATHADGREERRTDRDLAPLQRFVECAENDPVLSRAVELVAEYGRSRNLRPLSRLWDVLKNSTGEDSDVKRHAALAKLAGEAAAWAGDVGQSLHALRHEIQDAPRLAEADCHARMLAALQGLMRQRCGP